MLGRMNCLTEKYLQRERVREPSPLCMLRSHEYHEASAWGRSGVWRTKNLPRYQNPVIVRMQALRQQQYRPAEKGRLRAASRQGGGSAASDLLVVLIVEPKELELCLCSPTRKKCV